MSDEIIDLLQIKIEKAKNNLSDDTLNAIAAIDWKMIILGMRERRGFTFEQLGNLELETELLLCGLLNPADYSKELEKRMEISKAEANELTEEMNKLVFERIKEELIKNTERKRIFQKRIISPEANINPQEKHDTEEQKIKNTEVLKSHGIEIIPEAPKNFPLPPSPARGEGLGVRSEEKGNNTLPILEKLEISTPAKATPQEGNNTIHPILSQKLSGPVQAPVSKTEHTLSNLTPGSIQNITLKTDKPRIDPYREIPE